MSSYCIKNNVSKKRVLDFIEEENWINLSNDDLQIKNNRNEKVWRNDLAFIRKHLAIEGYFISNIKNDWSITSSGEKELKKLCQMVLDETNLKKVTSEGRKQAERFLHSENGC